MIRCVFRVGRPALKQFPGAAFRSRLVVSPVRDWTRRARPCRWNLGLVLVQVLRGRLGAWWVGKEFTGRGDRLW